MSDGTPSRIADLMSRRRELLGPAYRTFYGRPVEIVRGVGTRLYDRDGVEYLDAYNNVPCVGHSNPRVTAAITAQAGTLNTHTRYPAEPILDYAERLLGSLGSGLSNVMFTCTGSEANDLALRIARFHSGRTGVVVTANAYHGVTAAVAEASPSLGPIVAPGPQVRTIAAPDPAASDPVREGERMGAELRAAAADLERSGLGFAALLADTVFSSDGIVTDPAGFLGPLADEARRLGGVFIADEVQAGFGRLGEVMWGFRRHEVAPDLVTLGKPMGNGMPIAAVVARGDLLAAFGDQVRYFNTFGGNSVSIAAATAVLDVLEDEALPASATAVGSTLRDGLATLAADSRLLGAVRGAGLFIGVDVRDVEAAAIVDGMRERRVLLGATGPDNAVLKIRPPLCFSAADADLLLTSLAEVLNALSHG